MNKKGVPPSYVKPTQLPEKSWIPEILLGLGLASLAFWIIFGILPAIDRADKGECKKVEILKNSSGETFLVVKKAVNCVDIKDLHGN